MTPRLAFLLALIAAPAFAQERVEAENPPGYGWMLGDELIQRVRIFIPEGESLDMASLPRPREVAYWLELGAVETREIKGGVEVTLRWRNFYAALEANQREVAPSPIRILDAQGAARQAEIPGFSFVTSPIRPLLAPSAPEQMRPDPHYRLIDPRPHQIKALAALAAALGFVAVLAWTQAWPPFHARRARPLTQAARLMARSPKAGLGELRRILHRGLDSAFGGSLIGADLEQFLTQAPIYRPLEARLAGFFAASEAAFFGKPAPEEDSPQSRAVLRVLARDLAAVERGRR